MLLKLTFPNQPDLLPWVRGWLASLLWPEAAPASMGMLTPLECSLSWTGPCALAVSPPEPDPFARVPSDIREVYAAELRGEVWSEAGHVMPQWLLSFGGSPPATLAFIKLQDELRVAVTILPEVIASDWPRPNLERWRAVLMGSGIRYRAMAQGTSQDWTMPAALHGTRCGDALRALCEAAHHARLWAGPQPEPERIAYRRTWAQLALRRAIALGEQTPGTFERTLRFAQSALYELDPATAHLARSYPLTMDLSEYPPDESPAD